MTKRVQAVGAAVLVVVLVVVLSWQANKLWPVPKAETPSLSPATTFAQLAAKFNLPTREVRGAFDLASEEDLSQTLQSKGLSPEAAKQRLQALMERRPEAEPKNFKKIGSKFALWALWLLFIYFMLARKRIKASTRKWLLLVAVGLFGVVYGADISPMGTVKDGLVVFGKTHKLFPPRVAALGVFLLITWLANRLLCGWGCQLGVLQDLLFRLNRTKDNRKSLLPQVKVPFALSNTVRTLVFVSIAVAALKFSTDLVEAIDPFKLFNPAAFGLAGGVFALVVVVASFFVYRPWCHFFCPFGLVGWVIEQFSLNHIRVDYARCIECRTCEKACPTQAMRAILLQERTRPDCYACGTCLEVCPTEAVHFDARRREPLPAGKFEH